MILDPCGFTVPDETTVVPLKILKRRIPMRISFVKGNDAKKLVNAVNGLVYFYRNFETRFSLRHGDVLLATFDSEYGNELSGSHYCVVLLDSSPINQVVTVIPLKSNKGRQLNPASDIYIGDINGLNNGKQAIAIVNQIRTIDKRRFFSKDTIRHLDSVMEKAECADYQEINAQDKNVFRLTQRQFNKIHTAARQYVTNGYIKHDN